MWSLSKKLILVSSAVFLAGCDKTKQTFGLDRMPPDEYQVLERAPLSMPPDYHLTVPKPGSDRPQESDTRTQAAVSVIGKRRGLLDVEKDRSKGLSELMTMAETGKAEGDIRLQVDSENKAFIKADKRFVDKLIFWQEQPVPGHIVDAEAEAKRIKDNQTAGVPLNEGETPMIERKRRAPLEGLFD